MCTIFILLRDIVYRLELFRKLNMYFTFFLGPYADLRGLKTPEI